MKDVDDAKFKIKFQEQNLDIVELEKNYLNMIHM